MDTRSVLVPATCCARACRLLRATLYIRRVLIARASASASGTREGHEPDKSGHEAAQTHQSESQRQHLQLHDIQAAPGRQAWSWRRSHLRSHPISAKNACVLGEEYIIRSRLIATDDLGECHIYLSMCQSHEPSRNTSSRALRQRRMFCSFSKGGFTSFITI